MKRTLEEAIKYYSELAEENEKDAEQFKRIKATQDMISHCYECAKEHRQLAEWLRELKAYRNSPVLQRWLKQCDTCKHESKRASEAPCKSCCHTFKNKHEEVKADDE